MGVFLPYVGQLWLFEQCPHLKYLTTRLGFMGMIVITRTLNMLPYLSPRQNAWVQPNHNFSPPSCQ